MRANISCDTLGDLDGGAARLIIDAAIREAINDLDDRAGQDGKPRKVQVTLTLDLMDNGSDVAVSVEAIAKVPMRKTAATIAQVRQQAAGRAELVYSVHAPEDHMQATIDEAGA